MKSMVYKANFMRQKNLLIQMTQILQDKNENNKQTSF